MFRFCLVCVLLLPTFTAFSQKQYPILDTSIDSLFDLCLKKQTTDTQKIRLLQQVDLVVDETEIEYPLFRGIIYMYQAFHAPEGGARNGYYTKGIALITQNKKFLADSFSYQCYQLLDYYSRKKRWNEWLPVDSTLRSLLSVQKNDIDWCILTYANKKLQEGSYSIANDLSSYDLLFSLKRYPSTTDFRLARIFDKWISLNSRFKQWQDVPYYKRNEKFTLKKDFLDLFSDLYDERDSLVKFNSYNSSQFISYQRTLYFSIYKEAVLAYAVWSSSDHREGQAILPLKNFLFRDVLNEEFASANKANKKPSLSCSDVTSLFSKLAELYISIGNGKDASAICKAGIDYLGDLNFCSEQEQSSTISYLFYLQTKANRIEGKYEASLSRNKLLKKWYPLPQKAERSEIEKWNWFIEVRLQEIFTLITQKKSDAAVDSLNILLDALAPIGNDSINLLDSSYQWPQLQYASMRYMAMLGKWDIVRDYTLEALKILEQDNHWENASYYYDLQLLYFISKYRTEKVVLKHIIYNFLFYTGRHLQHTFFMLTPEDRIRLYEQKLSPYFDLYHELLMNGLVDDDSVLKNNIIDQSLYLKNALIDANLLPNEMLAVNKEWIPLIEDIRKSRSKTNLLAGRLQIRSEDDVDVTATDGGQTIWLALLENANLDSLSAFTGWKKISSALKPNQVYIETIRYTNWLSDSASVYAAYIIKDQKLQLQKLYNEKQIINTLKDVAASPQSGVLNTNNTRGLTLTKKDKTKKEFIKGSEDKLGSLLLSPLWKYLSSKNELLIVPDGLLNRISLAALEYQHKPLFSYIRLKQLSGSYVLYQTKGDLPANGKVLLAGGLNYGESEPEVNINRLLNKNYSWQYLPATKKEVEMLQPIFKSAGENITVMTGNDLPDSLINQLSQYNIIHLATHGFYVDSTTAKTFYDKNWNKEAIQNNPMMRCGIAVSNANYPDKKTSFSDGHLLGFELANTDLRNCYLISLSACETGLGDLRNNLGVDGLSRALKLGGAKYLLISLWKVPDEPTAVFMQQFYKELFRLKDPAAALQSTQNFMSKKYDVIDWAAFVLVD